MVTEKIITGNTEEEVWAQLEKELTADEDFLDFNAVINQQSHRITLTIDIDLGGGFEGGYEITTLVSPLQTSSDFRFAIHHEDFLDEVGKFFGMQDTEIGYPQFDKQVLVKTNDETKVKSIFSAEEVRKVFEDLHDYTFGITEHNHQKTLELSIERGITNPSELKKYYHAFVQILQAIEA